ncbi:hypothetical protein RHMOL_Rhmol07G0052100 [Rhododendron molle]|uniref:Uncharacterized protein n=1 Tax=Rhododendron molle TaxID=49168 RepID=A0ACC0MYE2_RHOML|nr:hypothetical protein RHMOL_Rhmol07G0052100 [Rhododendron molle]
MRLRWEGHALLIKSCPIWECNWKRGHPGEAGSEGFLGMKLELGFAAIMEGYYEDFTSIEAELWAVYGGLYRSAKGSTQDQIESDSKDVIELIKKGGTQNFPRTALLEDTRFMFQRGGHEMQHIIREKATTLLIL